MYLFYITVDLFSLVHDCAILTVLRPLFSDHCFFSIVPGRLSGDKTIVERLVNAGLFAALIAQSKTHDRNTKERCVVTISLMADADTHIREALVGGRLVLLPLF